jgi:DNA-binding IclR family transcriptional regulator
MTITNSNNKRETTLDRAIKVLEYLADSQVEKNMSDIAKDLKIPNGTAYNILKTLESNQLIERDQSSKRYTLGFKLFQLGNKVDYIRELRNISMPYMRELTAETGETSQLGIIFEENLYFLEIIEAPKNTKTRGTVGLSLPLHAPAAGKILLAFQPEEKRKELLEKIELKAFNMNTITDSKQLEKELEEIRQKGYAVDREEVFRGTTCLAMPIYNADKEVIAALGITGDTERVKKNKEKNLNAIHHESLNISFKLGYQLS